ncbi:MAG: SOS response-associated peptidase [Flavobacteriales bacterium]
MCGRYATVTKIKEIEKKFGVTAKPGVVFEPHTNIGPGQLALVITSDQPQALDLMRFGLTPHWAKKPMLFINARSEGDHNPDDVEHYTGAKGILEKPSFRKPIRSQRCVIIADCFYEGPKDIGLSKPYCVYMRNGERPFAMAGIWDQWVNTNTGEIIRSFAIVTTAANSVLRKLGHHRSPLILDKGMDKVWLDIKTPLSEITALMRTPLAEWMNAYPVDPAMKNPRAIGMELLRPTGERIEPEFDYEIYHELEMFGMGETRARKRREEE